MHLLLQHYHQSRIDADYSINRPVLVYKCELKSEFKVKQMLSGNIKVIEEVTNRGEKSSEKRKKSASLTFDLADFNDIDCTCM